MNTLYKDVKTGEIFEKMSGWEIANGTAMAYFKTSRGAIIPMSKQDVTKKI